MDGKCTIFYEVPFWVGIFERYDEQGCSIARYVFGSEPTDAQLLQFVTQYGHRLTFSPHYSAPEVEEQNISYKRRQRQTRKQVQMDGIGTFAQRTLQAELERLKQSNQEKTRQERQIEEQEKFLLEQAKKKEKHRGR
ncbi:MAG: YjdF family protein [Anaerolineaceae bacterium]